MLKLSENLELPVAAVTQTFAFLGKRGGGKTYAASKLAEEMLAINAQVIVLDVVGTWYGLRVPKTPKAKAFDILVFGGFNGDIEINPKAGKIVAGIILEKNISAVVDISQFIHSEQTRFAYDFLITLFEGRKAKPGACHVFLEEAQELVPQNLPAGSDNFAGRMLHAGERLVKLGRNFGIGCSLISQRPQEVNKKVLNQTEVLLAFQMTGLQERKTIRDWVRDKGDETDVEQLLPKLETGQALIWSPTWLKISGTYKIAEKLTADVSATPEVGAAPSAAKKLAPVDVEELKGSIAALTAELEANTPAALKKTISDLERELAAANKRGGTQAQATQDTAQVVEWQKELHDRESRLEAIRAEVIEQIESRIAAANNDIAWKILLLKERRDRDIVELEELRVRLEIPEYVDHASVRQTAKRPVDGLVENPKLKVMTAPHLGSVMHDGTRQVNTAGREFFNLPKETGIPRDNVRNISSNGDLPSGERAVLTICSQYPDGAERDQITVLSGFKKSTRDTYINRLSQKGFIEAPRGSSVTATAAGIETLGDFEPLPTGGELQQYWMDRLPKGEADVLYVALAAYPDAVSRDAISEQTGFKKSTRDTYINRLGQRRLLSATGPGVVKASENLF